MAIPRAYVLARRNLLENQDLGLKKPEDFNWPATHIVLMYHGIAPSSRTNEASHLCNHTWCVRRKHLQWQEPRDNYARKNCNTWTKCPCGCKHKFNPCKHNPQCYSMRKCNCKVHKAIKEGKGQK